MLDVVPANAHVDFAAAKSIRLAVEGGACLTIEGGNITFECPGTITIHASQKSFAGPARLSYPLPALPRHVCKARCMSRAGRPCRESRTVRYSTGDDLN